jgi:hypothetical protein
MSTDDVAERHAAAEDERVRLGLLERHEKAVRERERARERRRVAALCCDLRVDDTGFCPGGLV